MAENNESTLSALREKHPTPHPSSVIPPSPASTDDVISVSEEHVVNAIRSFPNGSSGGPDGLRPQHLKDLTGVLAGEGGPLLVGALTALMNIILQGKTPKSIRSFFFGASLIALRKKSGGVRPIAVGNTLRRIAAKVAGIQIMGEMGGLLAPRQLGYGTPGGCEAAVHAVRIYLQPDKALLKLDFRNAFNSIRRDTMLRAVEDLAPELLPFVHSAYGASSLFWGGSQQKECNRVIPWVLCYSALLSTS